jgi:hypothetical protein
MKKRIQYFKKCAGIDYNPDQEGLDLFAELIIKECAELAGCNSHVSGFTLGDLIKDHFGLDKTKI